VKLISTKYGAYKVVENGMENQARCIICIITYLNKQTDGMHNLLHRVVGIISDH